MEQIYLNEDELTVGDLLGPYNNSSDMSKKKYYKSFLVKSKNNTSIISVSLIISFLKDNEWQIISRYYKVYSEDQKLDYINIILNKLFNRDIAKNIIYFFLRDSVHFTSLKPNNNKTLKTITTIKYDNNLKIYKSFIDFNDAYKHKDYKIITLILKEISKKFINLLNKNNKFDINYLFINKNNEFDFMIDYKIFNNHKKFGGKGWGMDFTSFKI